MEVNYFLGERGGVLPSRVWGAARELGLIGSLSGRLTSLLVVLLALLLAKRVSSLRCIRRVTGI